MTERIEYAADGRLQVLFFRVDGVARGKGSFRLVKNKRNGKMFPVTDTPEAKDWEEAIGGHARYLVNTQGLGGIPIDQACRVALAFRVDRPQKHWTAVGGRPSVDWRDYPDRPGHGRYDVDKKARLVLDALVHGGVLVDDSRVCSLQCDVFYTIKGVEKPGVDVTVTLLEPLEVRQERPRGGVVIRRAPEERGTRG